MNNMFDDFEDILSDDTSENKMTNINHDALIADGWTYAGFFNNREFYDKGDFTIVEHNGTYMDNIPGTFSGDKEFTSMEDLKSYYKYKVEEFIETTMKLVDKCKQLNTLFNTKLDDKLSNI